MMRRARENELGLSPVVTTASSIEAVSESISCALSAPSEWAFIPLLIIGYIGLKVSFAVEQLQFTRKGLRRSQYKHSISWFQKFKNGSVRTFKFERIPSKIIIENIAIQESKVLSEPEEKLIELRKQKTQFHSILDQAKLLATTLNVPISMILLIVSQIVTTACLLWEVLGSPTSKKIKVAAVSSMVSLGAMIYQIFEYDDDLFLTESFSDISIREEITPLKDLNDFQRHCIDLKIKRGDIDKRFSYFKGMTGLPYNLPCFKDGKLEIDSELWTSQFICQYLNIEKDTYDVLVSTEQNSIEDVSIEKELLKEEWHEPKSFEIGMKELNSSTFIKYLAGHEIKTVPGDGNCLFSSLEICLNKKDIRCEILQNSIGLTQDEIDIVQTPSKWGNTDILNKYCNFINYNCILYQFHNLRTHHVLSKTFYPLEKLSKPDGTIKIYFDPVKEHFSPITKVQLATAEDKADKIKKIVLELFDKIFGLVFGLAYIKITDSKMPLRDISSALHLSKQLSEGVKDVNKILTEVSPDEDPINVATLELIRKMRFYMHIPIYKMVIDSPIFDEWQQFQIKAEKFITQNGSDKTHDISALKAIANASSERLSMISSQHISSLPRQVPTLLLIWGKGAVGKTVATKQMARECATSEYPQYSLQQSYGEFTTSGKYWESLRGTKVGFYDEIASSKELENDILLRDFRGIVDSTARNCEGAAINLKSNPFQQTMMFCTANTEPNEISTMIGSSAHASSVKSYWRRIMCFEAVRNSNFPKIVNDPIKNTYSKDMSHIQYRRWEWNDVSSKMEPGHKLFTYKEVKDAFTARFNHNKSLFKSEFEKFMADSKRSTDFEFTGDAKLEGSVEHFVINMHGTPNQGKSHALEDILSFLRTTICFAEYKYAEIMGREQPLEKKAIILVDDVVKIDRDWELNYMRVYNQILQPGSIIIVCTNETPKPYTKVQANADIVLNRESPFVLPGVVRRLGFTGYFYKEDLGNFEGACDSLEYFVENRLYYRIPQYMKIQRMFGKDDQFIRKWAGSLTTQYFSFTNALFGQKNIYKHQSPVLVNKVVDDVWNHYKKWLEIRKEIPISHEAIPSQNWDMILVADKPESVKMSMNPMDMADNLFTSKKSYEQCKLPWKMLITTRLFQACMAESGKFMMKCDKMDEKFIFAVFRKYVDALKNIGIDPRLYVKIDSLGEYAYTEGRLYVNTEQEIKETAKSDVVIKEDWCMFSVIGKTFQLSWDVIVEHARGNFCVPIEHHFSNEETKVFGKLMQKVYLNQIFSKKLESALNLERTKKAAAYTLNVKEKVETFMGTTQGKYLKYFFFFLTSVAVLTLFIKLIASAFDGSSYEKEVKGARKIRTRRDENTDHDSDDHADPNRWNNRIHKQIKGARKLKPKRNEDTDREDSDFDGVSAAAWNKRFHKQTQESIKTLPPMNYFDNSRVKETSVILPIVRKNLGQFFCSDLDSDTIPVERGVQLNYMFMTHGKRGITVRHAIDKALHKNFYVGADEFGDKLYKVRITQKFNKSYRDLAQFEIVPNVRHFPDVRKHFISEKDLSRTSFLIQLMRYHGKNNAEQFHIGQCYPEMARSVWQVDSKATSIEKYAKAEMLGTFKYTSYGDCGLPYMACDRRVQNKIAGIHIMGSVHNSPSTGIFSIVTCEDLISDEDPLTFKECEAKKNEYWDNIIHESQEDGCNICYTSSYICREIEDDVPLTTTMFADSHIDTVGNFTLQIYDFVKMFKREAAFTKNYGTLWGSVKHPHTKFYFHTRFSSSMKGKQSEKVTSHELGLTGRVNGDTELWSSYYIGSPTKLLTYLNDAKGYRLAGRVFQSEMGTVLIECDVIKHCELPVGETEACNFSVQILPSGDKALISKDVLTAFNGAYKDYHNNRLLPCVPFEEVEENETVMVIGKLRHSYSFEPKSPYIMTPWFHDLPIPPSKLPMEFDVDQLPLELVSQLEKDRSGKPSARVTQSLQWAHMNYRISGDLLLETSNEFKNHINLYYSKLRLLSEEQVLHGFDKNNPYNGFLAPLNLDSSAGWTLKFLYNGVNKKSDVMNKSETGVVSWNNTDAARDLRNAYFKAITALENGENIVLIAEECSKMEKLKTSKYFVGRTFCSMDFLSILLERHVFGYFTAKAMKDSPVVGVGMDGFQDFDDLYNRLRIHPNVFAIDYKRFDKTIPSQILLHFFELLAEQNPHLANQIKCLGKSIVHRLQISGNTLFQVLGGMPSGCFLTAPLNSEINHFLVYICFHEICLENDIQPSWELFRRCVECIFYGDDALVSVSDEIAEIFNRTSLCRMMKKLFGMNVDSANKDGNVTEFDKWEDVSFISRFFRHPGDFPAVVGALKKITILSYFHYTKSNDPQHLATLLERALLEASAWGIEFFNEIRTYVDIALEKCKPLRRYIIVKPFDTHLEILRAQIGFYNCELHRKQPEFQTTFVKILLERKLSSSDYRKVKSYESKQLAEMVSNYVSQVNELYQKRKIASFNFSFDLSNPAVFKCKCEIQVGVHPDDKHYTGMGYGRTKSEAKEGSAFRALESAGIGIIPPYKNQTAKHESKIDDVPTVIDFCLKNKIAFWKLSLNSSDYGMAAKIIRGEISEEEIKTAMGQICKQETNDIPVSGETGVPTNERQVDPTLASDNMLFTNVGAPTGLQTVNMSSSSVVNPQGTGAPFDFVTRLYNIFRSIWTTHVNGTVQKGALVGIMSLNPETWDEDSKFWYALHRYYHPQIIFMLSIGGAAGSIGWLKFTWHRDDSNVKFEEGEDVTSSVTNLNMHQVKQFALFDARTLQQMRPNKEISDDLEPFPCYAVWMQQPAQNVQKNNDVNYPIECRMKFGSDCMFVSPRASYTVTGGTGGNIGDTIRFQNHITQTGDWIISDPGTTNILTTVPKPEVGYLTGNPTFTFEGSDNVVGYSMIDQSSPYVPYVMMTKTLVKPTLAQCASAAEDVPPAYAPVYQTAYSIRHKMVDKIYFGFGDVPETFVASKSGFDRLPGTIYRITPFWLQIGAVPNMEQGSINNCRRFGRVERIQVFERGMIIEAIIFDNIGGKNDVQWDASKGKGAGQIFVQYYEYTGNYTPVLNPHNISANESESYATGCPEITKADAGNRTVIFAAPDELYWRKSFGGVQTYPSDRFFEWNIVQTGNVAPTSALPNGIRKFDLARSGSTTSLTQGSGINVPPQPGSTGILDILEAMRVRAGTSFLTMDLISEAGTVYGEVGYVSGTLVVRSQQSRIISTGHGNGYSFTNIQSTGNLNSLANFPTNNFTSWTTSGFITKERIGTILKPLTLAIRTRVGKQEAAAILGGAAISGVGNGLSQWGQLRWQKKNFRENWKNIHEQNAAYISAAKNLQEMKGQNELEKIEKQYELRLRDLGARSASAQAGNHRYGIGYTPGQENPTGRVYFNSAGARLLGPNTDLKVTDMLQPTRVASVSTGSEINMEAQSQSKRKFSTDIHTDPEFQKALADKNISKVAIPGNYDTVSNTPAALAKQGKQDIFKKEQDPFKYHDIIVGSGKLEQKLNPNASEFNPKSSTQQDWVKSAEDQEKKKIAKNLAVSAQNAHGLLKSTGATDLTQAVNVGMHDSGLYSTDEEKGVTEAISPRV